MQKEIIRGVWSIVALELRDRGEWKHEMDFGPDEWTIGFMENGRLLEIFRPENEKQSGRWVLDECRGILMTAYDTAPEHLHHHVFEGDENGAWLYVYEDAPHIPFYRNLIVAHHSRQRLRMVR
jgi:hypothetical protein